MNFTWVGYFKRSGPELTHFNIDSGLELIFFQNYTAVPQTPNAQLCVRARLRKPYLETKNAIVLIDVVRGEQELSHSRHSCPVFSFQGGGKLLAAWLENFDQKKHSWTARHIHEARRIRVEERGAQIEFKSMLCMQKKAGRQWCYLTACLSDFKEKWSLKCSQSQSLSLSIFKSDLPITLYEMSTLVP